VIDGSSKKVQRPRRRSRRWTSFVGLRGPGRITRMLQQESNPRHRLRVEHNRDTLLIHLSGEDGSSWTVIAIDRATREWAIAQRRTRLAAAEAAKASRMQLRSCATCLRGSMAIQYQATRVPIRSSCRCSYAEVATAGTSPSS
jgi:hypothetical protein